MKIKSTVFALMAVACCVSISMAQETEQKPAAECEGTCPVAAAMDELPKMTYKVGEEVTCCSESAAALAKKAELPVQFVVGEETFEAKEVAFTSLVEQTEAYVTDFLTPCACETSGTTTIAGKACSCPVQAGARTELVKAAADKVTMTYAVGEKACACPNEAAALAKSSGEAKVFVIGEAKTPCELTARLTLAQAKYKAAVQAVVASEQKEAPAKTDG